MIIRQEYKNTNTGRISVIDIRDTITRVSMSLISVCSDLNYESIGLLFLTLSVYSGRQHSFIDHI